MNHSMQIHARIYFAVYCFSYMCICSHNFSIMYQRSNVQEGNFRKRGALGGENSLTGAVRGMARGGPEQGQGQGLKKITPHPGPLTRARRGIESGACQLQGTGGPVMNTRLVGSGNKQMSHYHVSETGTSIGNVNEE